jgi:dipeptidyl aminopeptidase/acylaminoacyl peptidase
MTLPLTFFRVLLFLIFSASLFISVGAFASTGLMTEDFSQLPDVGSVQLSPDGKKLASVIRISTPDQKGMGIQVMNLESNEKRIVLFSDNSKYFLYRMYWKDKKTLLVSTFFPSERDTWTGLSQFRTKSRDFRLLVVDVESGSVTSPLSKTFLKKYKILPFALDRVADPLPQDPEHIIMQIPGQDTNWLIFYPALYKVNIKTQKAKLYHPAEENVVDWVLDQKQNVRLAIYYDANKGIWTIRHRAPGSKKWQDLWTFKNLAEDKVNPIGFGNNPDLLYVTAYQNDKEALFEVNLKDPALHKKLLLSSSDYDIQGDLVYSPVNGEVIGIDSEEIGGTHFFDPELQKLKFKIDKALGDKRNYLYGFTQDLSKFLVFSSNSQDSGTFYIGHQSPVKLNAVAYQYKKLVPELMAKTQRIEYKARDGLIIEAFLTLPRKGPQKNLPTLMFPHSGLWARDSGSFDYWTQFFANKGYAVLQMNFRGSDGLGYAFRDAGLKSWGKTMQDDIEDGAKKLITDGIADPKAIGIVGASYGGYAALMGVVKTPDFYRCSISVNGVSNVYDFVKDHRDFSRGYNSADHLIGNDNATLKAISPVNFAEKIKAPVLLVHGTDDRQVEIKHGYQMRDALQKAKKDVTFVELPSEDHYLMNEKNRMDTFRAMDSFLNKCMPTKTNNNLAAH